MLQKNGVGRTLVYGCERWKLVWKVEKGMNGAYWMVMGQFFLPLLAIIMVTAHNIQSRCELFITEAT